MKVLSVYVFNYFEKRLNFVFFKYFIKNITSTNERVFYSHVLSISILILSLHPVWSTCVLASVVLCIEHKTYVLWKVHMNILHMCCIQYINKIKIFHLRIFLSIFPRLLNAYATNPESFRKIFQNFRFWSSGGYRRFLIKIVDICIYYS